MGKRFRSWLVVLGVVFIPGGTPDDGEIRRFAEAAPAVYRGFFEKLGLKPVQSRELNIRIFSDFTSYKEYQSTISSSKSDLAFYSLFNSEVTTWAHLQKNKLFENLLHESSHHYIRDFVPRETIPRCLDEGIAEIFEVSSWSDGRISPGNRSEKWSSSLRKARQENRLRPFIDFIALTPKEFVAFKDPAIPHLEIAECWGFSYFLVYGDGGRWHPLLQALLLQAGQGTPIGEIVKNNVGEGNTETDLRERWEIFLKTL